jgi:phage replication-related protein YjqB (UPF0714/DUF867 family)
MACFFRRTRSSRVRVHLIACLLHQNHTAATNSSIRRRGKTASNQNNRDSKSGMQQLEQATQSPKRQIPNPAKLEDQTSTESAAELERM